MPNEAATWIEAEKGKKRTPVKRAGRAFSRPARLFLLMHHPGQWLRVGLN